ncbi:hypothetical protein BESB_018220 [Besnoitia besnoiti]|uniref:2-C-methyl-D-erythritol 4-phosphate cytidylyltransferase n=1 Tax=Besnoitia besnoiti TaxID=94643 RepID=A0A2A9M5M8_BESBE|nr:hypothetical protein BESB_018220 [Besnoitia besnoiti]PFH32504.1 hypothetical protein BESB_018220 [Besnoitia besnoiti]
MGSPRLRTVTLPFPRSERLASQGLIVLTRRSCPLFSSPLRAPQTSVRAWRLPAWSRRPSPFVGVLTAALCLVCADVLALTLTPLGGSRVQPALLRQRDSASRARLSSPAAPSVPPPLPSASFPRAAAPRSAGSTRPYASSRVPRVRLLDGGRGIFGGQSTQKKPCAPATESFSQSGRTRKGHLAAVLPPRASSPQGSPSSRCLSSSGSPRPSLSGRCPAFFLSAPSRRFSAEQPPERRGQSAERVRRHEGSRKPSAASVALHGILACGGVGSRFGGSIPKQFVPLFRGQTAAQISFEKIRAHLTRWIAAASGKDEQADEAAAEPLRGGEEAARHEGGARFLVVVADREWHDSVMTTAAGTHRERVDASRPAGSTSDAARTRASTTADAPDPGDISSRSSAGSSAGSTPRAETATGDSKIPVDVLFAPIGSERWESVWHGVKCLAYGLLATEVLNEGQPESAPASAATTCGAQTTADDEGTQKLTGGSPEAISRTARFRPFSKISNYVASHIRYACTQFFPRKKADTLNVRGALGRADAQGETALESARAAAQMAAFQAEEAQSLLRRLAAVGRNEDLVMIHDAARPCVREEDLEGVSADAIRSGAAVLAIPAVSTIKLAAAPRHPADDSNGFFVQRTLPRHLLWEAQTPQVIRLDLLLRGYTAFWKQWAAASSSVQQKTQSSESTCEGHLHSRTWTGPRQTMPAITDDASLLEFLWSDEGKPDGGPSSMASVPQSVGEGEDAVEVKVRKGDATNIKITLPVDYALAQCILNGRSTETLAQRE